MIEIIKPTNDPWFNIAAEEYAVHHLEEEIFMLWQNTDCIVMGKHQHSLSEINLPFIEQAGIPAIRRISGGGTVFQGEGNLNFSFIRNHTSSEEKINFDRATAPILHFLQVSGIHAKISDKSNITVDGKKISGNAAHLHKNRSLHHGTLLYDADLEKIKKAIQSQPDAYQTKAIPSNRVKITNLKPLLHQQLSINDFASALRLHIRKSLQIEQERGFTTEEIRAIEQLAASKYRSWEWNFGYSPDYNFTRSLLLDGETIDFQLHVHRGVINNISISRTSKPAVLLCQALTGSLHNVENMRENLTKAELHHFFNQESCNLIIQQLL